MFRIKLIEDLSEKLIEILIEMDHRTFPEEDWITIDEANMIYKTQKNSVAMLYENEKPIGYVTILMIKDDLVKKAVSENYPIYKIIDHKELSRECLDAVYLHCFSILPEYRNKGLVYMLYNGLYDWLNKNINDKSDISLYAEAVSDEGLGCLERLGFEEDFIYSDGVILMKNHLSKLKKVISDSGYGDFIEERRIINKNYTIEDIMKDIEKDRK